MASSTYTIRVHTTKHLHIQECTNISQPLPNTDHQNTQPNAQTNFNNLPFTANPIVKEIIEQNTTKSVTYITEKLNQHGISNFTSNKLKYALGVHRNARFVNDSIYFENIFSYKSKLNETDIDQAKPFCLFYN